LIRNSIEKTKKSTFLVRVPSLIPEHRGFPFPNGTGFFISGSGYFITANHVLESVSSGEKLMMDQPELEGRGYQLKHIDIVERWPHFDIALLKVDFGKNSNNPLLGGRTEFYYLDIDFENCLDGTPVYSYGFPLPEVNLSEIKIKQGTATVTFGFEFLCPRVTSAIVSSNYAAIGPITGPALPKWYVIDKALNYGNSGGPIILMETGKVIAVCARFQPVSIRQAANIRVTVPSLYSIASSLANIKSAIKNIIKSG
jgi:S1-C subfamily serine protease